MNPTLMKAIVGFAPVSMLFVGSVVLFARSKSASSLLQAIGAGGLLIVVLAHICEAFHLLPWMGWGMQGSIGHYIDLAGAILGLVLFPAGYLLHALRTRHA